MLDEMLEGARRKTALSRDLLDQGGWDLFYTVFGEAHCAGHQFWKLHDETHPWHDAEERRRARRRSAPRGLRRARRGARRAHRARG